MDILIVLAGTIAAVMALRNPIRKWPWLFYLLALALDIVLLAGTANGWTEVVRGPFAFVMRKGGLGVALFVVVMYIGVLPRASKVSHWLRPIRAELSIMACILIAGHMVTYLMVYVTGFMAGSVPKNLVLASFVVALCLLTLAVVLGITSLRAVKHHMKAKSWRKLQRLAYVFYALILVHLLLMLGPAAFANNSSAVATVAVYSVIFVGYIIARLVRARIDAQERVDLAETIMDQGFVEK